MDLNKETAMRLWVKQFVKRKKAIDFTGREIAKTAYNNRGSKYGWNVDHIFPVSKGSKTADYNLICCHIQTNSEKANPFPYFRANEKIFEIQKRQNHYEIVTKVDDQKAGEEEAVNFLDAAQGLKCWKQCRSDNGKAFVGYVKIKVETSNESHQLLKRYGNFLIELFLFHKMVYNAFIRICFGGIIHMNTGILDDSVKDYYRLFSASKTETD